MNGTHSIKVAAKRTGLSAHVIRAWERRYGVVKPARTGTQRRLYSDADIERLRLLRLATRAGHSIGNIAHLPAEDLKPLAAEAPDLVPGPPPEARRAETAESQFLEECVSAIRRLDSAGLESGLSRAAVALGSQGLLHNVIAPLAQQVGDLWRDGVITAAHEHFASAAIRAFLNAAGRPFALTETAPVLVVGTPAGQLHEMGAVMVAAAASALGWRVTYLGTSLPAVEIVGAAIQNRARAVALSIVYPEDDPNLPEELQRLRRYLPPEIDVIAGGRAAASYQEALDQIGARRLDGLEVLSSVLDELRRPARLR